MLDANPAYAAPASLQFADFARTVGTSIHAGLYYDETAATCHWHLPLSHMLESWSDARSVDGTATIVQPVLAPLYSTSTTAQLLAMLAGFLGGLTDKHQRSMPCVFAVRHDGGSPNERRHVNVVPTSVLHARVLRFIRNVNRFLNRQRVDIRAQRNHRTRLAALEQRHHAGDADARLHLQPKLAQMVGDEPRGAGLLLAELGMLMDVAPPSDQLVFDRARALADFLFQVGDDGLRLHRRQGGRSEEQGGEC